MKAVTAIIEQVPGHYLIPLSLRGSVQTSPAHTLTVPTATTD